MVQTSENADKRGLFYLARTLGGQLNAGEDDQELSTGPITAPASCSRAAFAPRWSRPMPISWGVSATSRPEVVDLA